MYIYDMKFIAKKNNVDVVNVPCVLFLKISWRGVNLTKYCFTLRHVTLHNETRKYEVALHVCSSIPYSRSCWWT